MKLHSPWKSITVAALALVLSPCIHAQVDSATTPVADPGTEARTDADRDKMMKPYSGTVDLSALTGMSLMNLENETIGEVEHVIVDSKTGKVRYAILGVGGFLGMGETKVAVPWSSLNFRNSAEMNQRPDLHVSIDATKKTLTDAPKYDDEMEADSYEISTFESVDTFWGMDKPSTRKMDRKKQGSDNTKNTKKTEN